MSLYFQEFKTRNKVISNVLFGEETEWVLGKLIKLHLLDVTYCQGHMMWSSSQSPTGMLRDAALYREMETLFWAEYRSAFGKGTLNEENYPIISYYAFS